VNATQFGGKTLLDGSADSTASFQIGANTNHFLTANFGDFNLTGGEGERKLASRDFGSVVVFDIS